tara:strand:+ start:35876 stop:36316 length:441 start_codon:yes stop_codon:yes gene_type:complete
MEPSQYLHQYSGKFSLRQVSPLSVRPGDLIHFEYPMPPETKATYPWNRFGLVVRSKRTSSGHFLSTQNNTLLNVVVLETVTEQMFASMVNTLYKNRKACDYYSPAIIGSFLGKENFRTFDIALTSRVVSVEIKLNLIRRFMKWIGI